MESGQLNTPRGIFPAPCKPGRAPSRARAQTLPGVPAGSFTYATALHTVTPHQPFRLIWSCYDGSGPHLSWSADVNATVSVIPETTTVAMNSDDPLPTTTGSAIATITTGAVSSPVSTSATFDPEQDTAIGGPIDSIIVCIGPLTVISDFAASQPDTDPATGAQTVTFSWQIANATGFTISQGTTQTNLPYTQPSCQLTLPTPLAVTTYTFTATGFGKDAPYTKTIQVTPNAVVVTSFNVSGPYVDPAGQQSVTVDWQAANVTEIIVTAGTGYDTPGVQATSASVLLPPPGAPPQPAQYPVELVAEGYLTQYRVQQVTPVQVQGLTFTASSLSITKGDPVTLSLSATAATGFILSGTHYPVSTRQVTLSPKFTTTYSLTAQGYTAGTQFPSKKLTVIVSKDGTDGKESVGKEVLPDKPLSIPLTGSADPEPAEPPGGGQQPFIAPYERPEVGGSLRDGGSGPPVPPPRPARNE